METKVCKRDGAVKPVTEFWKSKTTRDGLQSWCKECITEYKKLNREWKYLGGAKLCQKCREFKPRSLFGYNPVLHDKQNPICKDCEAKQDPLNPGKPRDNATQSQFQLDFAKDLSAFDTRQLLDELKCRGYTGELTRMEKIKL